MRINYTYNDKGTKENLFFSSGETITKSSDGFFLYEKDNHLGNVMVVTSDRKLGLSTSGSPSDAELYRPQVLSAQDFFCYGAQTPGRKFNTTVSDFGFNAKREEPELYGEGNSYDFGARMADVRLGRWMSPDKKERNFAGISTYAFSYNSPVAFNDPNGESGRLTVNHSNRTITLEQTVFLYGADVKTGDGSAEIMNEIYNSAGPSTRTVMDENGEEWTITIKMTYSDVNADVLNTQLAGSHYKEDISNINTQDLSNFQEGDFILRVDASVDLGDAGGHSGLGAESGIAGKGATRKTKVHEPFHGLGFEDAPGIAVYDDKGSYQYENEFPNKKGKWDVMQEGGLEENDWGIKNRHYYDLLEYVKKNYGGDVTNEALKQQRISPNRKVLTQKEENKINAQTKAPSSSKNNPKASNNGRTNYGKPKYTPNYKKK